jgi:hypothetical protein
MESDSNSEKWSPPSENRIRPGSGSQPQTKSFFEKECLQQTWLNVKLATWLKCIIIILVLIAVAAHVLPRISSAQSSGQQEAIEFSEYQYEEGSWYDSNECFLE